MGKNNVCTPPFLYKALTKNLIQRRIFIKLFVKMHQVFAYTVRTVKVD